MILVWAKSLHIAALVIWCAGLLTLPVLMAQREAISEPRQLDRLHAFTRFAYVVVISPAAFIAVGSGTALVLLREVFTVWFAAKLLLVGALVAIHVRMGLLVLSVFDEGGHFRLWRVSAALIVTSTAMAGVLWLVLAKPAIPVAVVPEVFREPGGLRRLAQDVIPGPIP